MWLWPVFATTAIWTESEPLVIRVRSRPPRVLGPFARAVRLLDRFAYGPDLHEVAAVLIMGEKA